MFPLLSHLSPLVFGDLLVMLAQHDRPLTVVSSIDLRVNRPLPCRTFWRHFASNNSSIYTSGLPPDFQPGDLAPWLDPLALGWLSDGERESLVRPITLKEVLEAIRSFPSGKSPGPDSLFQFYKTHGDLLAPKLAQLYSQCLADGALPASMSHAHVILIHKVPKDPTSCASYRLIAINTDVKILAKLLNMRIQPLLPTIIETDQTGFMANKATDVNLRHLFTNIHAQHLNEKTRVVASLDIKKAFNTVESPFL